MIQSCNGQTLAGTTGTFDKQPGACEDREKGGKEGAGEGEQEISFSSMDGVIVLDQGWPF